MNTNDFVNELIQHENDINEGISYDYAISNFRRAKSKWSFNLSPITFLTGTNNSGKSSFLKSLLILEDYAESNNHFELSFNGPNYKKHKIDRLSNAINWEGLKNDDGDIKFEFRRFGFYVQLIFTPQVRDKQSMIKANLSKLKIRRLSDNSQFSMDRISEGQYQMYIEYDILSLNDEDSSYYALLQNMGMKTIFEKQIKELEEKRNKLNASDSKSIVLKQELNQHRKRLKEVNAKINNLESEQKNKFVLKPQFSLNEFRSDKLTLSNILQKVLSKYFEHNEKKIGNFDQKEELLKILNFGDRIMRSIKFNTHHLSPQRNSQTRLYLNENTSNDIYELINWHSENPLNPGDDPYTFIQDYMKVFNIGDDFRIKDIEGLASIIEIHENGDWRNIVDKGFGVGQLFAIIFRIGLCINDYDLDYGDIEYTHDNIKPIILIEEPEGNLHPGLQSKLADLFYEAYLDHGVRFIIETHSEYLIRRSQVLMSKWHGVDTGYEDRETRPFGAFYFDLEEGPYNMIYREDGKFENEFGPGFFDESSNLAFDIL
ncbi:AAA family ATPase [Zunongwangia endophytica]|nr:AAA family ATPase [Zunongwangia endophytica]MDN3594651.1 AAA family ATPase [Zunongwangia endophytica]